MTSLVPLEIGTEENISGAHNVPRGWPAMVHKNVVHHKRIEISKNSKKKRHCTGNFLFANDAKKGSLASYMNTLPHRQTQKCTLDFVWINVLSGSSIAKQQQQPKKKHVTSGIVARNVLSSTKCVGGSRDKRSLIKTFATWILPCAKGLFQHLYTESSFETIFSPPQDTLPSQVQLRAAKESILVVACWRMIGGFFHCCYLKLPFRGRLQLSLWTMAHSWALAQWNLKLSLAHHALRGP
jgi:hypothetical protein